MTKRFVNEKQKFTNVLIQDLKTYSTILGKTKIETNKIPIPNTETRSVMCHSILGILRLTLFTIALKLPVVDSGMIDASFFSICDFSDVKGRLKFVLWHRNVAPRRG